MSVSGIAVLTDLDGTLLKTAELHRQAFIDTYQHFGATLTPETCNLGRGFPLTDCVELWNAKLMVSIAFSDWARVLSGHLPRIEDELANQGLDHELVMFLDHLHTHRVPRAIVTSNSRDVVMRRLQRLGLLSWFEESHVVTSDDLQGLRAKPHPDSLHLAAALLNVSPSQCVFIGDSWTDVAAGKAAGMATIGFAGFIGPDEQTGLAEADLIVQCYSELAIPKIRALLGLHPTAW